MKSLLKHTFIGLLALTGRAQDKTEWELPTKNDLINIEYSKEFSNKKKELCSYYTEGKLNGTLAMKITAELSGKGGKLFSNTDYHMTFLLYEGNGSGKPAYVKCDPQKNDTAVGTLYIMIGKKALSLLKPGGLKVTSNTIRCSIKVIFTGSNKYDIKFRGFVLTDRAYNATKGGVQTNEVYLEDVYNEFSKTEKKKKDQIEFFKDLKGLVDLFQTSLAEELERNIKVNELD